MGLIQSFLRLKKNDQVSICCVSDLLKKGFDPERLADEFVRLNYEVWGEITDSRYLWTREKVLGHFKICPQHIYCAFENNVLVATLTNMKTTGTDMESNKTWLEKTGEGFLTTHRPGGDLGFGVDLTVSRKASKKVSNRIVLAAMVVSVLGEGVKAVYLGARIPGYHKYVPMPVEKYVYEKRKNSKPLDPEIYFYLKQGFEVVEIIPEYMDDALSLNYGVLIRWENPLYKITKIIPILKPMIRIIGNWGLLRVPGSFERL